MPMNAPANSEVLFATADRTLLAPYGLDAVGLTRVFGQILSHQVDYADLYFQYSRGESWSLEEGIVKSGSFHIEQGVGVRAVSGEKTAFAYSDDISLPALESAAQATRAIARQGAEGSTAVTRRNEGRALYLPHDPIGSLKDSDKVALLERLERMARARDPRVQQVIASLAGEYEVVLVARSDGVLGADVRPLVRLSLQVIAEENGRREQGSAGGGGRFDYAYFSDEVLRSYADKAVDQALINLQARAAPAGKMTVVLGPGWPGVLLHEAVGHGLEGDFNRKGSSAFSGRIGERVASPGRDGGGRRHHRRRRGSLNIDDEGNPTQRTVLIEDGVLRGYLQDSLNARLMGVPVTGNGRRESFAHAPMPRMTNTYMLAGDKDPQGDHCFGQARAVRGELRRRAGRHRQRQVRVLRLRGLHDRGRQGHLSGQGRHPDRQRPRRPHARIDDRQRPGARHRCGHLRERGPERAGGRGSADACASTGSRSAARPADQT